MSYLRSLAVAAVLSPLSLFAADAPKEQPFDVIKFAGLPPEQAAKEMTMRPGFSVKLFAGEPDVKQPIAMATDDRGRLWIAEAYTYPNRAPEGEGKDRILVFEDTDGDGHFDKRTVFYEGLNLVSGMEVGFGGVWIGAAPYFMFIPIADGDTPKPAGEPKILLDGFGLNDTHEMLNTFNWGPDGWLYGCHGVFTHSAVGRPGTPGSERTKINAGVWRYHPTRHVFEVFAEGTSNPWGVDFDEHGQAFVTACVIPHLYHIIQGAHYQRQAGSHFNEFVFADIRTCADHVHYASATPHAGNRRSGSAGGGHAHCGAMIYLGGSWPAEYRNQIFMNNIHGARINMDLLQRQGSGFVGKHGEDFLLANDEWSQILNLRYGPDGSVYMIDWYDKQACHTPNAAAHDRTNGRIFKVVHENDKPVRDVNLGKLADLELAQLQLSPNEWYVRTARRLLQERALDESQTARRAMGDAYSFLTRTLHADPDPIHRLHALWALHVARGLTDDLARPVLLNDQDEYVRAWAIQLLFEQGAGTTPPEREHLARLAKTDPSPVVRLYLASAAQKIPPAERWDLAAALAAHAEDVGDQNLPLMAWWAFEPLVPLDPARALSLATTSPLPLQLKFTARRTAAIGSPGAMNALAAALAATTDATKQLTILQGMLDALKPGKAAPMPPGWEGLAAKLTANAPLRDATLMVSAKMGSASARATLRQILVDAKENRNTRQAALETLLGVKDDSLAPTLQQLVADPLLRAAAIRALAAFSDAATPEALLGGYAKLEPAEKRDALATLSARASYAKELVAALEHDRIPARDLTAELVRQLRAFQQPELNAALDRLWGTVRDTPAEKQKEIAHFREVWKLGGSTPGDPRRGRVLFARTCAQCHTLFGEGAKIGPDLTGSNRKDVEYLLENIVTPNAVIPNDYRAAIAETNDGRTVFGLLKQQDAQSVTLASLTETATLSRKEIKKLTISDISMMPEGLLTALNDQEVRDLFVYLRSPEQVPMAGEAR
jgi:putative membrane-bound dehydrogenase-like protein